MELQGVVKKIMDPKTINDKSVQLILIQTDEKFPQTHPIEFWNDKRNQIKEISVNQNVIVKFNIKSNLSKAGGYFTKLTGWSLKPAGEVSNNSQQPAREETPFYE